MPKDSAILDLSNPETNRLLREFVKTRKGLHWVDIHRSREQRSLSQNAYMWAGVLPHIAKGITEAWGEMVSVEEAHEYLKREFLSRPLVNKRTGEVMGYTVGSTADLDTAQFAEYLDKLIKFAAESLSVEIPPAMQLENSNA